MLSNALCNFTIIVGYAAYEHEKSHINIIVDNININLIFIFIIHHYLS